MTHQEKINTVENMMELIEENGFDGMAKIMEVLLNFAMKVERERHNNADHYERSETRKDSANGYKPKSVRTRVGDLSLMVPQTRYSDFYPSCLEKGIRSERALNAVIAEMYITGTSTRKVQKVAHHLGLNRISSTQAPMAT